MNRLAFLLIIFSALKAEAQISALSIADSLHAVGKYSAAIEELEKIAPRTEAVLVRLAKAQESGGQPQAALETYRIILDENPGRVLTALNYGKLLNTTGKLKEADSIFSSLIKEHPGNAGFHYQLGVIREKRKDSTAMTYYSMTTMLDRNHQQALFKVAKDHLSHRRYAQAEYFCKQGLETNPTNPSLLSILAQTHYNQKEYKPAIDYFSRLVALGHGSEFVHTKLGFAHFQLKQPEEAIEQYSAALDYEEGNPDTHHSLGKIYAYTGAYEESEKHLLLAVLLKKQPVDAEFLSLGLTYKFMEDYKNALKYLNLALEENPDNERALYERAIAADNYYEDLETRMNYYQAYLNKFEEKGNRNLVHLAKRRIKDIREELYLDQ